MGLIVKDSGGAGFEPVPAGTYVARCVNVIDIGIQTSAFGDKEKLYIGFEIPSERVEWEKDGQKHEGPAMIGSRYTASINAKSILGQHLTSWRGKPFTEDERAGFDLFTILGAPCMINVVHNENNGKVYANIQSIMRLPKGMECPPAESELIAYTPMDNAMAQNLDKLPEWLQKLCRDGHRIAEGSTSVGSALAAENQAGGQIASGQPAPQQPPQHQTAAQAMDAAMANQQGQAEDDYFDESIPF